jgi:hypothetical protein
MHTLSVADVLCGRVVQLAILRHVKHTYSTVYCTRHFGALNGLADLPASALTKASFGCVDGKVSLSALLTVYLVHKQMRPVYLKKRVMTS